jgi:ArsR family transcriptional regulator
MGPRQDQRPGVRAVVAPVIELHFSLFRIHKEKDTSHPPPPWIADFAARDPATFRAMQDFWSSRGLGQLPDGRVYVDWGEFVVAAARAASLVAPDVAATLAGLEAALASDEPTPPLGSEPADVWQLIDRRLALLRGDAAARRQYAALIAAYWQVLKPVWEGGAKAASETAAAEFMQKLRTTADWRTLVPGNSFVHKEAHAAELDAAAAAGTLYVIPLGLGGGGQMFWALPGYALIGFGVEAPEQQLKRREQAEQAAARFKVLSDPTRLSILRELTCEMMHSHPATITDLASFFQLSQPTVSVHMKALREAGLVQAEKHGNQTKYHANPARVREFVEEALEAATRVHSGAS